MDKKERIGRYIKNSIGGEEYQSYVPQNLPPKLDMDQLYPLLDEANIALGRLDGMSTVLPDSSLFLYMYVRKEAVLSSQIEGTQSTLSDLLLFETKQAPGAPIDDVTEVSNYVAAMDYGLKRLKELPLSLRLIKEIHSILMQGSRGSDKSPGEFRKSQNWIGGSRPGNAAYVPPPHELLMDTLGPFEKFLHDETIKMPVLIKVALAHVQFETIHPFLDGNGRVGRLLITFILCAESVLKEPLLYLSLYLKTNRDLYYDLLQSVRETGDWERWIEFFLNGVIDTSNKATETAKSILQLFEQDREKIENVGTTAASLLTIHSYFQRHPITNTTKIKSECSFSLPTILRALSKLEDLDIIKEVTGKDRNKIFVYRNYLDILNSGTEPIKA